MESLTTPQSDKWHGLAADDTFAIDPTDEEKEYFEKYRDYLFTVRYDPRSGFVNMHQRALRATVALGNGVGFIEDAMGAGGIEVPYTYRYLPITKCWIEQNKQGNTDSLDFLENISARVMMQRWGEAVSAKVKEYAADPAKQYQTFPVLHSVYPQTDRRPGAMGIAAGECASAYIEMETRHVIRAGGFHEFPFVVYAWNQSDIAYSESALMFALAEVKALQAMGKTGLRVHQMMADPPLAVAHDGIKQRMNFNPRAVNFNMMTAEGKPLVAPIHTAQLPQVFNEFVQGKREMVENALYLRLFAILVQNPQMTATEAMIRANEKGELLGPAGSRIQATMGQMVDRETAILGRYGVYEEGTALTPPRSLGGRSFGAKMTSPLDRIRRASELIGIRQSLDIVLPLAQTKPEVMDNFDGDEIARISVEVTGAPQRILLRREEVAATREQRAAEQARQVEAEALRAEGEAAQQAAVGAEAVAGVAQRLGPGMVDAGSEEPPPQRVAPPRRAA
jgi:hypothetical protein